MDRMGESFFGMEAAIAQCKNRREALSRRQELREAHERQFGVVRIRTLERRLQTLERQAAAAKDRNSNLLSGVERAVKEGPAKFKLADGKASERLEREKANFLGLIETLAPNWHHEVERQKVARLRQYEQAKEMIRHRRREADLVFEKEKQLREALTMSRQELILAKEQERTEAQVREMHRRQLQLKEERMQEALVDAAETAQRVELSNQQRLYQTQVNDPAFPVKVQQNFRETFEADMKHRDHRYRNYLADEERVLTGQYRTTTEPLKTSSPRRYTTGFESDMAHDIEQVANVKIGQVAPLTVLEMFQHEVHRKTAERSKGYTPTVSNGYETVSDSPAAIGYHSTQQQQQQQRAGSVESSQIRSSIQSGGDRSPARAVSFASTAGTSRGDSASNRLDERGSEIGSASRSPVRSPQSRTQLSADSQHVDSLRNQQLASTTSTAHSSDQQRRDVSSQSVTATPITDSARDRFSFGPGSRTDSHPPSGPSVFVTPASLVSRGDVDTASSGHLTGSKPGSPSRSSVSSLIRRISSEEEYQSEEMTKRSTSATPSTVDSRAVSSSRRGVVGSEEHEPGFRSDVSSTSTPAMDYRESQRKYQDLMTKISTEPLQDRITVNQPDDEFPVIEETDAAGAGSMLETLRQQKTRSTIEPTGTTTTSGRDVSPSRLSVQEEDQVRVQLLKEAEARKEKLKKDEEERQTLNASTFTDAEVKVLVRTLLRKIESQIHDVDESMYKTKAQRAVSSQDYILRAALAGREAELGATSVANCVDTLLYIMQSRNTSMVSPNLLQRSGSLQETDLLSSLTDQKQEVYTLLKSHMKRLLGIGMSVNEVSRTFAPFLLAENERQDPANITKVQSFLSSSLSNTRPPVNQSIHGRAEDEFDVYESSSDKRKDTESLKRPNSGGRKSTAISFLSANSPAPSSDSRDPSPKTSPRESSGQRGSTISSSLSGPFVSSSLMKRKSSFKNQPLKLDGILGGVTAKPARTVDLDDEIADYDAGPALEHRRAPESDDEEDIKPASGSRKR